MHYLDVFIESVRVGNRLRVQPLPDQGVPLLFVACSRKTRSQFPPGTIFKADLQVVRKGHVSGVPPKDYYRLRKGHRLTRAIEYFEHNLELQKESLCQINTNSPDLKPK